MGESATDMTEESALTPSEAADHAAWERADARFG
jgi:hypothetical protein